MRRTTVLAVGVTILGAAALMALAAPARGGLGRGVSGLTTEARRRIAAFRTDMAVRESELRAGLLPSEADVTAARARRAGSAPSAPSPDPAVPPAWRATDATEPDSAVPPAWRATGASAVAPASADDTSAAAYPAAPPPTTRP